MDGLESIVDWLNQPSTDWLDPFQPAPDLHGEADEWDGLFDEKGAEPLPEADFQQWTLNDDANLPGNVVDFGSWDALECNAQFDCHTCKGEIAQLRHKIEALESTLQKYESSENRLQALEQRVSNVMGLSAEMSMAVNDIQLKSEGLSPLQKHFGPILMTRLADRR